MAAMLAAGTGTAASASSSSGERLLDYSSRPFDRSDELQLKDGWTVYRSKLIPAERFVDGGCVLADKTLTAEPISLPDIWGPALTTDVSTGHGVATYCIEVALPAASQFLGLRMGMARSIYSIYSISKDINGNERAVLLHENGDPSTAAKISANNPTAPIITLPFDGKRLKLVIQLANYVHKQGGIVDVPVIGNLQRLDSIQQRESALPTALVLVLLLVSAATFIIGRSYDHNAGHTIFAALSAASALRVLFVSNLVWDYFPSLSEARKYDLEYLSLFLIAPTYYAFICLLFRNGKVLRIDKAIYAVSGAFCLFALWIAPFCPPGTITLLREPFQLLWIVISASLGYTVLKSLFFHPEQKKDAVIVLIAALSTFSYELLSSMKLISSSMELSNLLVIFVTTLHIRAFVLNFRRVARERDALTQRLRDANEVLEARAKELGRAVDLAEAASRAKTEFLATVSHELRTPLNAVIGFSEMMKLEIFGPLGSKQYAEYAKDINDSGTHLLDVVNDILDLSRVEAGSDQLLEEKVQIGEIAQRVINLVQPQAEKAKVACTLEMPEHLPLLIADERKVRQILINIVSNAIKFNNENGTVEVKLTCNHSGLDITVADTGIGMRKEDIPKALARFGQVDADLNRKYEGLGIGLSIVQALIEQHEGVLSIDSDLGVGTTVRVHFPAERCILDAKEVRKAAGHAETRRAMGSL
jgi:signal transduction histidine kinase